MSFNDRCAEALYALKKGVDIDDVPGLRSWLAEQLAYGVAGISFPPRDVVLGIRDKGRAAGIDLYSHVCPMDLKDVYGDAGCKFCLLTGTDFEDMGDAPDEQVADCPAPEAEADDRPFVPAEECRCDGTGRILEYGPGGTHESRCGRRHKVVV